MIIGLSGRNASGKGAVARHLVDKGFESRSLSDVIREDLGATGDEPSREKMIERGNALRERFGASILADRVLARTRPDRNLVIDSIRHPAEIEAFRKIEGFILAWIESGEGARFERIRGRGRTGDPETIEAFRAFEAREAGGAGESAQQLERCREMADRTLRNDGPLDELHRQVDDPLLEQSRNYRRPPWDESLMEIARVVSMRSNCLTRVVAAIIMKDKRILSTGYNGSPRGTKNCNEGGCPRCARLAPSGTDLAECFCSHGEENAITQSAYHGVGLKGASIYSTFSPCLICTKMIINAGIGEVVYNADYPLAESSLRLLEEAGVGVRKIRMPGE